MTTYPKPRTVRLDDDELAIIQRIRATGTPGREVSFTGAVIIALHCWVEQNPVVSAEETLAALRSLQERTDQAIWDVSDV